MSKTKQLEQPSTASINSKGKRFIEEQFPINRLSKESYSERKAGKGQTLTGIGKWWGRKPLILVRATLLGLLMPASGDKRKDAEIFLKILMMDDEATWLRLKKKLSPSWVLEHSTHPEKEDWFDVDGKYPKWAEDIEEEEKTRITKETFLELPYEQRIELCNRPEEMDEPSEQAWEEINAHLGTNASSLTELFQQLGKNQFGYTPRAGDAFSGGGSIPFETARLGLDTFASDLNPVAGLLTYTSLNLIGGSEEQGNKLKAIQEEIFKKVDAEIKQLGIEHNDKNWRAEYFLYCSETTCVQCGWKFPLLPDLTIAKNVNTIGSLVPINEEKRYRLTIHQNVSHAEFNESKKYSTVANSKIICPNCKNTRRINEQRGDYQTNDGVQYGLRQWINNDIIPKENDVFQERLYCIRWVESKIITNNKGEDKEERIIHFTEPDSSDINRENQVLHFLTSHFADWQKKGYLPSLKIEPGYNTEQPIRERGWNYWHQLFCPRQLLLIGLFSKAIDEVEDKEIKAFLLNLIGRLANWNSRLSQWLDDSQFGRGKATYYNQALNTMWNYSCRGFDTLDSLKMEFHVSSFLKGEKNKVVISDCRSITDNCDFWITDPPYSDAVNYHELGDFFLAWYEKHLPKLFPHWYSTSQKDKAVKGSGTDFINSMIECYANLTRNMSDDGLQVVMFTHTNPEVWADLAMILWAAGLQVTASWNIATETAAGGVKEGNYVQSTALLICRKRKSDELKFKDELTKPIKQEVEKQIQSMRDVDLLFEKTFTDVDYFNAASAAALKVITGYQITELNAFDVLKKREAGLPNPLENLIQIGRRVAANFLRPTAIGDKLWDELNEYEKYYIKGLDIECQGDNRNMTFMDLAKGLGVANYSKMFASIKANSVRMKTPEEFGTEGLNDGELGQTLMRKVLFAVYKSIDKQNVREGQNFLLTEYGFDYQANKSLREKIFALLDFFALLHNQLPHWQNCSANSKLLATAMKNESV